MDYDESTYYLSFWSCMFYPPTKAIFERLYFSTCFRRYSNTNYLRLEYVLSLIFSSETRIKVTNDLIWNEKVSISQIRKCTLIKPRWTGNEIMLRIGSNKPCRMWNLCLITYHHAAPAIGWCYRYWEDLWWGLSYWAFAPAVSGLSDSCSWNHSCYFLPFLRFYDNFNIML